MKLEATEVLKGFKDKERNELVTKHLDTITNKFRGNRPVRLTKEENWLIFPKDKKTGISNFVKQHGHEALSKAVGFYPDDLLVITPTEDPEMKLVVEKTIQDALQAVNISGQCYEDTLSLVSKECF